jgi:hypothetical protein
LIYTSFLLRFFYMPFPGKVVPPLSLSLETVTCRQDDFSKMFLRASLTMCLETATRPEDDVPKT